MTLLEISCHRRFSPFLLELANGLIPQLPPTVGCSTSSRSDVYPPHHPSNSFLGLGIRFDWCDGLLVHIRSCDLVLFDFRLSNHFGSPRLYPVPESFCPCVLSFIIYWRTSILFLLASSSICRPAV